MSDHVADRIALQDVMLRYAAGVDERDFDLYSSCFIEDVEILDFGEEPINGRDNCCLLYTSSEPTRPY